MTTGGRDNQGRFARTLRGAERDAEACRLRASGYSYGDIASQLGYGNKSNAYRSIKAALHNTVRDGADDYRELVLLELDAMAREAWAVVTREHVLVSHGQVVRRDGQPIRDFGPVLAALNCLVKINGEKRKVVGVDAPAKSRLEVLTLDVIDAKIAELEAELAVHGGEEGASD